MVGVHRSTRLIKHDIKEGDRRSRAKQKDKAKKQKKVKANTVLPSVWAITNRFKREGRLPIPAEKFARKLQSIINASAEEKLSQLELTQKPEVRLLLIEALSTYPEQLNFLRQLKSK